MYNEQDLYCCIAQGRHRLLTVKKHKDTTQSQSNHKEKKIMDESINTVGTSSSRRNVQEQPQNTQAVNSSYKPAIQQAADIVLAFLFFLTEGNPQMCECFESRDNVQQFKWKICARTNDNYISSLF